MMRYCPVPSVTAVRVFSMRTGLAASTVTPGITAPDASRTVPATDACAKAGAGKSRKARVARHRVDRRIGILPQRPELKCARHTLTCARTAAKDTHEILQVSRNQPFG